MRLCSFVDGRFDEESGGGCTAPTGGLENELLTGFTNLHRFIHLKRLSLQAGESISHLERLSGLQSLGLQDPQVSDITPLASLASSQSLDLSGTQVSDMSALLHRFRSGLPVEWSSYTYGRPGIYVDQCPLVNPPPEIIQQGNDALLSYFAEREKGGVPRLYEAKMLNLGEGGAGKTSLLRRLYRPGDYGMGLSFSLPI